MDDKNQTVSIRCGVDNHTQGMTLPGKKRSFIDKFLTIQKETIAAPNDHTLRVRLPINIRALIQRRLLAIQKETIAAPNDHTLGMGAPIIPLALIQRRLLTIQEETIAAPNDHT
jgi:hypothetical protein